MDGYRICAGVRASKSRESALTAVNGRLFIVDSTSTTMVSSVLMFRISPRVMFVNNFFTEPTILSHTPPRCGAATGIHFHSIPRLPNVVFVVSLHFFISAFNIRSAATKFVPLSETISTTPGRRAVNRRSALINSSALMLFTISRCIALVVMHVKRAM